MSAGNPFSASTTDNSSNDPSMEEILASIRRIIADDQSISGHGALRAAFAESMPAHQEQSAQESPAELMSHEAGGPDAGDYVRAQHGSVAAPQYPMPAGPVEESRPSEAATSQDWSAPPAVPQMTPTGAPRVEAHVEHRLAEPAPPELGMPEAARAAIADPEPEEDHYVYEESTHDEQPYDESLAMSQQTQLADAQGLVSAATDTSIASAFNMLAASRLADNSDELMTMVREMIRPLLRSWLDDNLPTMVERMVRAEIERVARGGR